MTHVAKAISHVAGTSKECGKAAMETESTKLNLYKDLVQEYEVVPVALETLGSWGPSSLKFIEDVGKRIIRATGEKKSKYFKQFLQAILVTSNFNGSPKGECNQCAGHHP